MLQYMVKAQWPRCSSKQPATSNKQRATRASTQGSTHEGEGGSGSGKLRPHSLGPWGLGQGMPRPLRPSLPSAQRTSALVNQPPSPAFSRATQSGSAPSLPARAHRQCSQVDAVETASASPRSLATGHPSSHARPCAEPHLLALPRLCHGSARLGWYTSMLSPARRCLRNAHAELKHDPRFRRAPSRPLAHRMPPPQCLRFNLSEVAAHVWRCRILCPWTTDKRTKERGGEGWRSRLHLDARVARS